MGHKEEIFYGEGGETLEQVVQISCGWLINGSVQNQVGWRSEQPFLVKDIRAHGR